MGAPRLIQRIRPRRPRGPWSIAHHALNALVATGDIDAVYFFVDPLSPQPHDPDIRAPLRVCNVHNVPLATNLATADLVMASLADERVRRAAGWASPD